VRRAPGIGLAILFLVLVVLHYSVRPLLDWRASADFLLIAVLLIAVRVRPGVGAVIGFVSGMMADALAPSAFGAAALALTLVGFGASWLKDAFFAEHVALNAIFLFLGKLAYDIVFLMAEGRLHGSALLFQLGVWTALSAAVTAFVGLAVLLLFRPLIDPGPVRR
jgi:rod shape-determining protein MreD